jgi:uncharacterized protein (DUF983 family)
MIEFNTPHPPAADRAERDVTQAMLRGARQKCPACGQGALYGKYLKVVDSCGTCGTELHHQRADDAPPYFTMIITGHVIVGGLMALEQAYEPPMWVHIAIWGPALLLLTLFLLPRVKGALIGLQWALRMHGFGGTEDVPEPEPVASEPARR